MKPGSPRSSCHAGALPTQSGSYQMSKTVGCSAESLRNDQPGAHIARGEQGGRPGNRMARLGIANKVGKAAQFSIGLRGVGGAVERVGFGVIRPV